MVILCAALPGWAATDFSVTAKVDFDTSAVTVTVETPAQYGQNILVTIYPKGSDLSDPAQYIRIGETFASRAGKAEIVFNLSDVALGDYTVSATGGGYLAESCHATTDIYFETTDDLNNVTLPAVSTATGETLNTQLVKLQRYFNIDLGEGYAENPTGFLQYFEAVRAEDYRDTLDTMSKVQETAERANLIMKTLAATGRADLEALYEANDTALSFDKADSDYSENKAAIYSIYLGLVDTNRNTVRNMGDLRVMLRQAIGMAVINTKNAENVTETITAYGDSFGIPLDTYSNYCGIYGSVSMNMNFIGRNFTKPSEVLAAYRDAVTAVTGQNQPSGGGSLSPSGGGGGNRVQNVVTSGGNSSNTEETKPAANFTDVAEDYWAYEPVKALTTIGVLSGFEDGSFQPDVSVTREQFVKMLVTAFKLTDSNAEAQRFEDVPEGHWAGTFIQTAAQLQLVSGISETEFGLGSFLTRQDTAVLLDRTLTYLGISSTGTEQCEFTDWRAVSDYAAESVTRLCAAGIIQGMGDGSFAPDANLTRAQAAKILYAVLSLQ
ncbi:MAG: S-layer homology domain-containing protein, partial [Clostridia bacterium]